MENAPRKQIGDINNDLIRQICVDYIVHELPSEQLCTKYQITRLALYHITARMSLPKRREKYRRLVLDKAIRKFSHKQSVLLTKSLQIILKHVEAVECIQKESENGFLSEKTLNGVMKAFEIMTKEQRLDKGESTENLGVKVTVVMDQSVPIIGEFKQMPPTPQPEAPKQTLAEVSASIPVVDDNGKKIELPPEVDVDDVIGALD